MARRPRRSEVGAAPWLSRAAGLVALSVLFLSQATPALAHAAFVSGTPGPGEAVIGSPAELVVEFSQDLVPARSSLEVRDASGTTLAKGGAVGDGPRELRLALPVLTPGTYEVRWTSFSAEDDELERGSYTFTVIAAPTPSPAPARSAAPSPLPAASPTAPTTAPSPTPTASPADPAPAVDAGVIVPIVAALVVVAGLAAWLLRRRAA